MDQITKSLYKKHKICLLCKKEYGSDCLNDSGTCPICTQYISEKNSKLTHTAKTTGGCSGAEKFH